MIRIPRLQSAALAAAVALTSVVSLLTCLPVRAAEPSPAELQTEGLVLWLDADDTNSLSRNDLDQVSCWADRSGRGNDARQIVSASQPRYVPEAIGGKPALHFDGSSYLNLGRPESLDFKPGDPFTMVVVYRVTGSNCGTFISKGGGAANQRAYQFYTAPRRQGAIAYGVMRENGRSSETNVAVLCCDGSQVDVILNGQPSFSFKAAGGVSEVDVLIGCRRQNIDNTGTFYMLTGDLSEVLVYDRALTSEELGRVGRRLKEKYSLGAVYIDSDDAAKLVAMLRTPEARAKLDAISLNLIRLGETAVRELRSLLNQTPQAASTVAELLVKIAEQNQLSTGFAELAAGMLENHDPFVSGMAEWALAMKVGGENNGQQAVWPSSDPPAWYKSWSSLSAERMLEADWVRQAVSQGIHRDKAKMLDSVKRMIARAERMVEDYARETAPGSNSIRAVAALRSIRDELAGQNGASYADLLAQRRLWVEARRSLRVVVLDNPALDFDRLLFVKQFVPHTVRNITRSYSWKHKPGGDICILSDLRNGGEAGEILQGRLGPGYVWGIDLWWDADRVVFGYAKQPNWPPAVDTADSRIEGISVFDLRKVQQPLHLFEAGIDGTELEQLTGDPYWSDFEPTYCANGDVVFASDRCGRAAECGNDTYDHTNPNLYVLSADDRRVRHLTDSKDIDRYPHSLGDGRIAYTHWEYQERHFMEVHALWTLRPDGSMCDALFKHHMRAPCGLRDTRSIPRSTKLVSIATGHHTFAYGPVVVVDPNRGLNSEAGLAIVTPGVKPQEGPMAGAPVAEGGVPDRGGLYQTPWALSEKCFLVSYSYARPECTAPAGADSNGFAIYLIDVYGNRELIHRDPILSCTFPIPLRKRPRPPILPDIRSEPVPHATCYVGDVYDGMGDDVPRGTIKYIRIMQHVGWPFDSERGQLDYIPGNAGTRRFDFQSWSPVRVIGTAAVAADGSAAFHLPADTGVYFQALDQRQMEIRRMRSLVSLKAGEVRGCRGCHETQGRAPAGSSIPLAMTLPPQVPKPPPWGSEKTLGYEWLVQPILDDHCVRCHDGRHADADGLDFTSGTGPDGLYRSFRTIFGLSPEGKESGRVLVSCSDRFSNADVSRPMEFGSHKSPLIRVLLDDELHRREVRLSQVEWLSLVTWVDANAPYHDSFINKRPPDGGEPIRDVVPDLSPLACPATGIGPLAQYGRSRTCPLMRR